MSTKIDLTDKNWAEVIGFGCCDGISPRRVGDDHDTSQCDFDETDVSEILYASEGSAGSENWILYGRLQDGRYFLIEAGCSYTGWDYGHGDVYVSNDLENLARYGMTDEIRAAAGIELPVSQEVRLAAEKCGMNPVDLDRTLREKDKKTRAIIYDMATDGYYISDDFWHTIPGKYVENAFQLVLEAVPDVTWMNKRLRKALGRKPTDSDRELFTAYYRMHLLQHTPVGERFLCKCGKWEVKRIANYCAVCRTPVCSSCMETPIRTGHRDFSTCGKECSAKIPDLWKTAPRD